MEIINRILVIIYVLAILNCLRHVYNILLIVISDAKVKYILSGNALLILGMSVAYIITGILMGIVI